MLNLREIADKVRSMELHYKDLRNKAARADCDKGYTDNSEAWELGRIETTLEGLSRDILTACFRIEVYEERKAECDD